MPTSKPITWDAPKDRIYEAGVSKGVIYKPDPADGGKYKGGAAWNGLINVSDTPSGADNTKLWADGIEYANMRAAEQYGGSIEAYTYPEEFAECDGSAEPVAGVTIGQQIRKTFGLCWRTELGNAETGLEFGYKLHLAYGLTVSPSEKSHDTINDSPDAATMSWDFEGTPVNVTGHKPTAKLEINSTKVDKTKLAAFEKILYGSEEAEARMPLPDEVFQLLKTDP